MATLSVGGTTVFDGSATQGITSATTFPAGHVIQTVSATKSDEDSTAMSSATFQKVVDSSGNPEWSKTIDNVAAGNDIIVSATWTGYITPGGSAQGGAWGFIRGSTTIYTHTNGHGDWDSDSSYWYATMHMQYLDSNLGAGSHSYYLGCREYTNATVQVNSSQLPFNMILQEIQR